MAANYTHVNGAWPDNPPVPTPQEALAGARRLVRLALTLGREGQPVKKFTGKFKLTSGTRRCWTRYGIFHVNPNNTRHRNFGGWKGIVHDVSHWAGHRLYADFNSHDHRHAFIERTLAEHVVKSGWLDGKLKRPAKVKAPSNPQIERAARIADRIVTWERKQKRAETALRKLRRQQKYYAAKRPPVAGQRPGGN